MGRTVTGKTGYPASCLFLHKYIKKVFLSGKNYYIITSKETKKTGGESL